MGDVYSTAVNFMSWKRPSQYICLVPICYYGQWLTTLMIYLSSTMLYYSLGASSEPYRAAPQSAVGDVVHRSAVQDCPVTRLTVSALGSTVRLPCYTGTITAPCYTRRYYVNCNSIWCHCQSMMPWGSPEIHEH